jgi:predicted kinase
MLVSILSGLAGSGKSTYIKAWGVAVVCSADAYFMSDGEYRFDVSKLSQAHGACFKSFIEALQAKVSHVVVDNTNTTAEEIAPYMLGASAFGYDSEIVTLTCPKRMSWEDYIAACAARNTHGVPLAGIKAMADRIANRRLPPWWSSEQVEAQF